MRALGVLATAFVLLAASSAWPADVVVIGQVTGVRGDVFRESAAGREPAALGIAVRMGDALASYAGKARVQLNDGTILSLGENSRLSFVDYRGVANDFTTRLNAGPGVFRFLVHRLSAGGFTVETETAVASVRGTEWVMDVGADATGVALLDGVVVVSGRASTATGSVALSVAGQGTDVRRGSPPTPANIWGAQRFSTTVARATFD